jgi:tRNA threonylcarbamoyladenosine modification (KEOPS) complex Cgi121 subunit
MLYASAQRQIQRAIEHIGIKPQSQNMAVLIVGEDQTQIAAQLRALSDYLGCVPDESVLQLTADKVAKIRSAFQITDEELATQNRDNPERAIVDLVVEHIALLATQQ